MHRKASKVVALVAIAAILSLSAPGLFAAEKHRPKLDFRAFFEGPYALFSSLVSFMPSLNRGNDSPNYSVDNNVVITGTADVDRVSDGD